MSTAKRRGRPPRKPAAAATTEPSVVSEPSAVEDNADNEVGGDTDAEETFDLPSISAIDIFQGQSYTFHSEIPSVVRDDPTALITLGVDEAGRGPVLGPMVYGIAYCVSDYEKSLSKKGFDDSKKLTAEVRSDLLQEICTSDTELHANVGWAVRVMSARDITSGMLRPAGVGTYNLNAQAHDATMNLIDEVLKKGVNVKEIFVDTVGPAATYQAKLQRRFPTTKVTVSKKADSLYPSVSVASICAKVTRDFALKEYFSLASGGGEVPNTGSGYPSDPKSIVYLKGSMDSLFGWGSETRFSWSTTAELLKKDAEVVDWPDNDDEGNGDIGAFMSTSSAGSDVRYWFGKPATAAEL
ncbi:hypothetical protein TWF102_010091 [Orbilia oligospora]|uniref:Ribonuclease n=1 Tax=Orbilia oligospora TaxID=2813651 RepID=A0A7C8J1Z7_ORBOL|nr:hypothetical protein TWF103_002096 [Orbilia oligospora]KAF3088719.1 hypothetical protein TWF102_010091 [Orbilia oligospora]KAF3106785.1 hypothetical protein TWF706_003279 [Orbilia oligospora]KAF3119686.1 hypothetical protein TWF703_003237 [Orbilia oligospora]KAF3122630.1 hypothetical protein TWF594_002783 [Orbilia oligospora]